jgi:Fic family protein
MTHDLRRSLAIIAAAMPYIYQRKDWPRFRWDAAALMAPLSELRFAQGRLLGMVESLGDEERLPLLQDVWGREILSSYAIEGKTLDRDACLAAVGRRLGVPGHDLGSGSHLVEGVADAYADALLRYDRAVTDERLFGWHAALFPRGTSGSKRIEVAKWRSDREGLMRIVSGDAGSETVHFEAPDAQALPREMAKLLEWIEGSDVDVVLRAGLAHLWFVTLHPFEDGNGRIGRLLTLLMLARTQPSSSVAFVPSECIFNQRQEYYERLERAQRGDLDVTDWLGWFISVLRVSAEEGTARASVAVQRERFWRGLADLPLNDRQRRGLRAMADLDATTNAGWVAAVGGSHDSALRDLKDLVEKGVLKRVGAGGRGARYRLRTAELDRP